MSKVRNPFDGKTPEQIQASVQKGIEKARVKTARNLIAETDMDDATIAELTDLTEDQVRLLRSA